MAKKTIIGLTAPVLLIGRDSKKKIVARIDTGATKSSIDAKLSAELALGPVVKTKLVKSAHGNTVRPIVKCGIKIADKEMISDFTIADRTHLKFRVLVGQNILRKGFLIDPSKK